MMDRVIINTDTEAQDKHRRRLEAHRKQFEELTKICANYIDKVDKSELYKHGVNYFLEALHNKHSKQFPNLSSEKLCFLFDVPLERIKDLSNRVKESTIKIDPETGKEINAPEFNIYAETSEEIERFKVAKQWIDLYLKSSKLTTVFNEPTAHGSGFMVVPDETKRGHLKVNWKFIKGLNEAR